MDRLTLREAGEALGISKEAVRKRYERGSIEGEHGEDASAPKDDRIARLEAEIEYLREQLEDEKQAHREANRENRRIIAGFVQRIPELEAPQDPQAQATGQPETASEGSARGTGPGEPEKGAVREDEPPRRVGWRIFKMWGRFGRS